MLIASRAEWGPRYIGNGSAAIDAAAKPADHESARADAAGCPDEASSAAGAAGRRGASVAPEHILPARDA